MRCPVEHSGQSLQPRPEPVRRTAPPVTTMRVTRARASTLRRWLREAETVKGRRRDTRANGTGTSRLVRSGSLVVGCSEMTTQAPSLQVQPTAWSTVGAYVALTKPRIIELLLVTTLPTMVVARHGLPSVWPDGGHPGRGDPGRRRGQRHQHGGRPGHRPADEAHQEPPAGDRGDDAPGRPGLRPVARGGRLRRAVAGREPPLGRRWPSRPPCSTSSSTPCGSSAGPRRTS